jgi:HD-GYP domain-containing protein (c-di-GMP phosphodiesterase class II)
MSEQFPNAALYRAANVRTCIALPLLYADDLVGMLTVATVADIRAFTEYELELLRRLAEQTATALTNARLFTELLHAYDDTLKGWSHAIDVWSRDSNTHSQRVCEMTVRLAQYMDVAPDDLTHVQWGALLHDIGMIGVPDHIIRKTGVLTSEERSIVHQHPTYAYQTLSNIPFLRPVLDIPYYHHERWDGSGYPLGLKGTEIPLTARLFAVVDVWDTLHSERPYRPAWPEEQVVIYLRQQAGRQFDPDVVDAFLHLLHQEHEQLMEW